MKKTFPKEFARLNAAQKKAVETVEGPVMCIAGPGTGKTQVVAMRVASILRRTHARPSNILCLTFSVSGATAMRQRLRELIGADAYGVTINTIHGYCNDLIAAHPHVFERWSALEHVSDVERYRIVHATIDALLPDCVLVSKKNPYLRTRDIIALISLLKREGRTDPEDLKRIAAVYEEELKARSAEGTKAYEGNVLQARRFQEFIDVFLKYQRALEASGRYDYEDMVTAVIAAFEEEDWLLASQQERYQYILVDEFQDVNGAQYRVIETLTTARTPEDKPNLFVVGDDDQAIYRFQGANLANILSFHERFQGAPVIALTESYRCSQAILDAASSLIAHNTERLVGRIEGLSKTLKSASRNMGAAPMLLLAPSDMTEPWMVADLVEERLKQKIPPGEIAVLAQTNAELRTYYDVFTARAIPAQMTGKVDLLAHPLVKQVMAILTAVHRPRDSGKLAAALACSCLGCHPADLGRMFQLRRKRGVSLMEILLELENVDFALTNASRLIAARDTILDLHQKLESRTLLDTLEHVMKDCGLITVESEPATRNPASARRADDELRTTGYDLNRKKTSIDPLDFAALQEFFDRIKLRCYESPSFTFEQLLSDLEFYAEPQYADLRLSYDLPHLRDSGVQCMTAHQSKGLEFRTVILVNFRERHWNRRRHPPSIAMPEDLLFGWERDRRDDERSQDERRVAYVAMTRAKEEVIFTCPKQLTSGDRSRDVSPSAFFAEAGDLPEAERLLERPEQVSLLLFEPLRNLDDEFKSFLKSRLENYQLSVTALNHFLEDPQKFLLQDLLQIPQSKEVNFVYGNAVHDALRRYGIAKKEGKNVTQKEFLESFRMYLKEREVLTEAERRRLTTLGEESLRRYYEERLRDARPVVGFVEHRVSTYVNDVPMTGMIDRIDLESPNSPRVTVIDYKTGRPRTESQIRGGDYFRQLVFYALLLKHGMPIYEPTEFILDFVGEGSAHPVERRFAITEGDKRELTKVMDSVWAKMLALDFTPL